MASINGLIRALQRSVKPKIMRIDGVVYVEGSKTLLALLKHAFSRKARKKTPSQNNYFHGVALMFLAKKMECDMDDLCEIAIIREQIKETWGAREIVSNLETGLDVFATKSIGDYSVEDYQQLIKGVDNYCYHHYGERVPLAHSEHAQQLMDKYL